MSINSVCFVIISIALEMVVFWWFPGAVWEHLFSHGLICTESLNHTLHKPALWYKYAILSDFLMLTGAAYYQAQVFTNSDAANSPKNNHQITLNTCRCPLNSRVQAAYLLYRQGYVFKNPVFDFELIHGCWLCSCTLPRMSADAGWGSVLAAAS